MRSVVVTGGTVRLGKVIADFLRHRGWKVLVTSHRADAGADIVVDLADSMGAARCYSQAMALLGGEVPDALVNNAALFKVAESSAVENVNFVSPKKLTMLMGGRENGRGAVVNILDATTAGERPSAYTESKEKLRNWTKEAAAMFLDTLRVNAVSPGPVMPPVGAHERAQTCPLGRPRPEDVASAVAFLLENPSVTGAELAVDGGISIGNMI